MDGVRAHHRKSFSILCHLVILGDSGSTGHLRGKVLRANPYAYAYRTEQTSNRKININAYNRGRINVYITDFNGRGTLDICQYSLLIYSSL